MENGIEIDQVVKNSIDTENDIDQVVENGIDKENDIDVENDVDMEIDSDTKEDAGAEINFPRATLYENRLTLVHLSRKITPEMLNKMKDWFLEKTNLTPDDLGNVRSSIKLISLLEDKGIISMKKCTELEPILDEINPDLKEELSSKCKYFFSCYSIKTYPLVEGSYKLCGHSRGMQLDLFLFFYLCLAMSVGGYLLISSFYDFKNCPKLCQG